MTYKIQIDDEIREATDDEAAIIDASKAASAANAKLEQQRLNARTSALTKLKALGLTDDEITALIP